MKAIRKLILLFLFVSLNGCLDVTEDIDFYPDYFSELYTCPSLDFANSVFVFNDGTFKIVSIGVEIDYTYERKDNNIYYIYDRGALAQKILVYDNFYVMFQSDVDDYLILQMTEDMFDPSKGNLCFKRDYN